MAKEEATVYELIANNKEHLNNIGLDVIKFAFNEVAKAAIEEAQAQQKTGPQFVFEKMKELADIPSQKPIRLALHKAVDAFAVQENNTNFSDVSALDKSKQYAELVAAELKKESFFRAYHLPKF